MLYVNKQEKKWWQFKQVEAVKYTQAASSRFLLDIYYVRHSKFTFVVECTRIEAKHIRL